MESAYTLSIPDPKSDFAWYFTEKIEDFVRVENKSEKFPNGARVFLATATARLSGVVLGYFERVESEGTVGYWQVDWGASEPSFCKPEQLMREDEVIAARLAF